MTISPKKSRESENGPSLEELLRIFMDSPNTRSGRWSSGPDMQTIRRKDFSKMNRKLLLSMPQMDLSSDHWHDIWDLPRVGEDTLVFLAGGRYSPIAAIKTNGDWYRLDGAPINPRQIEARKSFRIIKEAEHADIVFEPNSSSSPALTKEVRTKLIALDGLFSVNISPADLKKRAKSILKELLS